MRRLLLIAAALLALTACNTAPQAGDVVDKDYTPGHFTYQQGCFDSKTSTYTCQIPVWNPDTYQIRLCAEDVCGWARVSESEYDQIEVGEFYDRRSG